VTAATPPIVLAIGGSDSGAGAGIQADLKAIAANGGYAATAITAVTAQNTLGVRSVHPLPIDVVEAQIEAVLADLRVDAIKTGYLGRAEVVLAVATALDPSLPLVVDPVMVNSAGSRIVDDATVDAYRDVLASLATVLTPNFREAGILSGIEVTDVETMEAAGLRIARMSGAAVLVTGGHLATENAVDILVVGERSSRHEVERIASSNVHGTGCSTASAIATRLASGRSPSEAYDDVRPWLLNAISGSAGWRIGSGQGPIDHFGWSAASRSAQPTDPLTL
jgi:hydroxymethylpyrimidine/phosphomethylpyrimidine kinase